LALIVDPKKRRPSAHGVRAAIPLQKKKERKIGKEEEKLKRGGRKVHQVHMRTPNRETRQWVKPVSRERFSLTIKVSIEKEPPYEEALVKQCESGNIRYGNAATPGRIPDRPGERTGGVGHCHGKGTHWYTFIKISLGIGWLRGGKRKITIQTKK